MRDHCPDPLIYYFHAAALAHLQAVSALGAGEEAQLAEQLDEIIQSSGADVSVWDLADASCARLSSMISGVNKWRAHPYRRDMPDPPVIWSHGSARLLDYGNDPQTKPVLVVPSLINKPYILDLMADASFLRHLNKNGLRPVLLDWGTGNDSNGPQTIDEHVSDVLYPAFSHLAETTGARPGLLGYCMGGTLAVGLAAHLGRQVDRLALIGAPWDFSKLQGVSMALRANIAQTGVGKTRAGLQAMGHHFGAVPSHVFQQLFAFLSPMQVVQKFSAFDKIAMDSARARKFAAVEDWLADGVCVKAPAAETILVDWYVENHTALGRWQVMGRTVDPSCVTCPTLVITGRRDHIVPPSVAAPLVALIPNSEYCPVEMGHVGMIVGSTSHAQVADRISDFFDAARM